MCREDREGRIKQRNIYLRQCADGIRSAHSRVRCVNRSDRDTDAGQIRKGN